MAGGLNRNIVVRLLADTSNYSAGMAKASAESQQLSTTMQAAGGKGKLLTAGLAATGLAASALATKAVSMAADFDAAMSTVQANTGASADEMGLLRQAAIDAGASTVYNASEAADAINELGKAGMTTADILSGGLNGALDLAASDGMQVSDAAELMSSTMAQFNLAGADATRIADALAAGAGKAQGSARDLGYALQQSGMVANSFGLSMEETTGTLTAFANSGMIGSDAGTSLKTMLIALANPSQKASELMDELGIHAYDAQGSFIGLAGLAGQLQTQMSSLSQEQRNQALATIFGTDAIRAANVLYNEGAEGVKEWTKEVSDSGYAAEQAAAKNDNLKGDLENLSGSFESLMISIGEAGQGPLRSLVQTADTLIDSFSGLPAPVQQAIVLFTALVGGSTALHSALKPLNDSTSGVAKNLGMIIDPGQRLTVALPQLKTGFTQLGTAAGSAIGGMSGLAGTATSGQRALSGLKSIGGGVVSLLGGPWGVALTIAGTALAIFTAKTQESKQHVESLQTALESTGDASEQIIEKLSTAKIDDSWIIPDNIEQAYYGYETLGELIDDVGIKMSDMALAAQGNGEAMARITAVTDDMVKAGGKQRDLAGIILSYLNDEKAAYDKASDSARKKKTALDEVNEAAGNATASTQGYADATDTAADSSADLAEQISTLADGFLGLNATFVTADEAVTGFNQKIVDLNKTISQNGQVLDANGNAIAGYEEKAYDSQSALQSLASSAQNAAQKIIEEGQATGQMTDATQRAGDVLAQAREAFVRNATASGMSAQAAETLADRYGLARGKADELRTAIDGIKEKKELEIIAHTEEAYEKITSVGDAMARLQNKEITVTQTMRYFTEHYLMDKTEDGEWHAPMKPAGGATGGRYSDGEFLPGYAKGGIVSGYVSGPGTGTSDSIWLSNARIADGEFVQSAAATDYYSPGFMSMLNERRIPRDMLMKAPQWVIQPAAQSRQTVNQTVAPVFNTKVVRSDADLHVAASILYRNAAQTIGRIML